MRVVVAVSKVEFPLDFDCIATHVKLACIQHLTLYVCLM